MRVRVIGDTEVQEVPADRLPAALADPDLLVWVDIPECDDEALAVLRDTFGFHPAAIWECRQRQRMAKVHAYADHAFVVLHAPEVGRAGHVHYVEIDQFIADRYLVTVHGPTNPAVPAHVPHRDTTIVWDRIREGRFLPGTGVELSHAIVASMVEGMEELLELVTQDVWKLEQAVSLGRLGDAEEFLDRMFRTRHGLLALANISATSLEVYDRLVDVARRIPEPDRALLVDNAHRFRHIHRLAEVERDYLQGVIEFYRTRTDTKMTIAAERLAVIAVVTLPTTALASVLGMNLIDSSGTHVVALVITLLTMVAMSVVLLGWARRQGWW